jgi:hypothetical protein
LERDGPPGNVAEFESSEVFFPVSVVVSPESPHGILLLLLATEVVPFLGAMQLRIILEVSPDSLNTIILVLSAPDDL